MEKSKIEKVAKQKEREIERNFAIDNKSVLRALARDEAAKQLYPTLTQEERYNKLYDCFYAQAKWQQSWEESFTKHGPEFATYLRDRLGRPSPRRKRVEHTPPPAGVEDPQATLGADVG